jgi:HEAT repeat protein
MNSRSHFRITGACLIVLLVLAYADAAPPDPVEGLRDALRLPVRDSGNKAERDYREANLQKRVKALKTIDEMREALLLQEWRDEDRDNLVAAVDMTVRGQLAQRFLNSLLTVLAKGTPLRKQAAAAMIGEIGPTIRESGSRKGLLSPLAPDLVKRFDDEDGGVREAAARAVGLIYPDPDVAAPALAKLLTHKDAATRRAAAEGLANLVLTMEHMTRGRQSAGVEATTESVTQTALAVVLQAGGGLKDTEAATRRSCLEAIQRSAFLLTEQVPDPPADITFPPADRKPNKEEQGEINQYKQTVEAERTLLLPLARALNAAAAVVSQALADDDLVAVETAGRALENMAEAREKLRRRAASVPAAGRGNGADTLDEDPLKTGMQGSVPALAKLLGHKDVRRRLAAIYVLETLETDATPAVDAVTKALEDANPFVRWGACRVLGKVRPQVAAQAVPVLAKLLDDETGDVRITALAALEHYGPAAKEAVPALAAAVAHKDATMRVPAIRTLALLGKEANEATPALVKALSDADAEVRQAAARALGKLGPPEAAAPALRKAMRDPDAGVRRAASAALLGAP